MNWKNENTNLYQILEYLEHEWYAGDEQLWNEPPFPFSYHNWLIDPKYKWEDMKTPKDKLDLPQDLAAEFIEDYKRKKLGLTS